MPLPARLWARNKEGRRSEGKEDEGYVRAMEKSGGNPFSPSYVSPSSLCGIWSDEHLGHQTSV